MLVDSPYPYRVVELLPPFGCLATIRLFLLVNGGDMDVIA
jgi:hypothetical protein